MYKKSTVFLVKYNLNIITVLKEDVPYGVQW